MGLMHDKRPAQYRSFMDERRWVYELARMHDGAFGISAGPTVGGKYEATGHNGGLSFGNYFPLVYTVPRKQLRIFGAPSTRFSKSYPLPARPWGTEADEVFLSMTPAEYAPGQVQAISKEVLKTDASMPIFARLNDPKVTDETLVMYAHHIDQGIRDAAAGAIIRHNRVHLIQPLLDSNDPRVRHAGLMTLVDGGKRVALADEHLTDAMLERVAAMVEDPNESWWVVEAALTVLGRANPAVLANHVDRLAYWLEHEDWWLRRAALLALPEIAVDKRYYKKILPLVGKMIATNERAVALRPVGRLVQQLQEADPEVQAFAVEVLSQAYREFPTRLVAPGGQNMSSGVDFLLERIARNLAETPGGFDALFRVSRARFSRSIAAAPGAGDGCGCLDVRPRIAGGTQADYHDQADSRVHCATEAHRFKPETFASGGEQQGPLQGKWLLHKTTHGGTG